MKELNIYSLNEFPKQRAAWTLVLLFVGGFLLTVFFSSLLSLVGLGGLDVVRCSIVLQNVLTFIMPAMLMAVVTIRKPWQFLGMSKKPSAVAIVGIVVVYVVSTPFINYTVALNESLVLPEWMSSMEQWMRQSEEAAKAVTDQLLAVDNVGELLLAVLLVGVLTGLGEEFFFRGAIMNLIAKSVRNKHVAVWLAAIIFSAFHLQFYGFIPRMLIGAILGYAFLWSGSIWVPVIGHAINNSSVVVSSFLVNNGYATSDISSIGEVHGAFPTLAIVSAVLTIVLLAVYRHWLFAEKIHRP